MRTAIDANIISSIWSWEPLAESVANQLASAKHEGALLISPFAYSELLAYPAMTDATLKIFLNDTGIVIDWQLDPTIWREAGERYARYAARRRQSTGAGPRRLLADYLIGTHALVQADRLLTLDPKVYRQDFPELKLL